VRRRRAYLGVFALGLAVRLLHLWSMRASPYFQTLMGDSRGYDAWARELAGGHWYGSDVFYQAPLYPYLLGAIYTLAGPHPLAGRFVQCVLGATACVLLASAGERFFSRRVGLAAGVALALYAPAVFFDGLIQKSSIDVFLLCSALALAGRLVTDIDGPAPNEGGTWAWTGWAWTRATAWPALGVVTGLLSLTRENALVLVPIFVVWPFVQPNIAPGRRWTTAGLLLVGAAAVLTPVSVRNFSLGGELFVTTSQFGPNFYIGNNSQSDGTYAPLRFGRGSPEHEREDATRLAERAVGRTLTPREVSGYWASRAFAFMRGEPGAWLTLVGRKAMLLTNAREMLDTEAQEAHADWSWPLRVLSPIGHFGVVVPLAVVGWCVTWHHRSRLWILYAVVAALAVTTVAFYVFARYRLPLAPVLIVFASAGVVHLWRVLRPGGLADSAGGDPTLPRGLTMALFVVAAVLSNWPLLSPALMHAISESNLGAALYEDGHAPDAERHYRRALAIDADYAPAFNNLGVVLRAQGRLDEAIDTYRAGVRARSDYPDLHYNLGNALLEKRQPQEAVEHLRIAARSLPDSAAARNNLGQALAELGDLTAAESELRRAVDLDPRSGTARHNLGNVLASQRRVRDAEQELRRAASLDEGNGAIWYDLGSLLLEAGRAPEAVDALARAAREAPASARTQNNLGIALAQTGRVGDAIAAFERALALRPDLEDARRNLAMARGAVRSTRAR
jgi:tetratricopeptide (TPR) repeat protein